MNYIKLFEKFESVKLSKTIGFLKSKIDIHQFTKFMDEFTVLIQKKFDIPISYISDDDIKVLNKNKALKVQNKEKEDKNKFGVDYLNFWFSEEEGHILTTVVGDYNYRYSNRLGGIDIDRIKNDTNILHGTLIPVEGVYDFQHLDKIIAVFSTDYNDKFTLGTIYIYNGKTFAIQDDVVGGEPDTDDWKILGANSWGLGNSNKDYFSSDCRLAVKYVSSDMSLGYNDIDNYYHKNVIIDRNGNINDRIDTMGSINKSDFALVISINNLIKKNKSVSDIISTKDDRKSGAIALLSDDVIKRINIDRYTTKLFNKYGIEKYQIDLKNIEFLANKLVMGKYALFSIVSSKYSLSIHPIEGLSNIGICIKYMISSEGEYYFNEYYSRLFSLYKSIRSQEDYYVKIYKENLEYIKSKTDAESDTFKVLNLIENISEYISKYILSEKINNIYQIYSLLSFFKYINSTFSDSDSDNTYCIRDISRMIARMNDKYEINHYHNNVSNNDLKESIKGLEYFYSTLQKKFSII
jgi:hypothetical protein